MLHTTLLSRYHITAELGHGGMGTVYRAHDTLLDREVAVKVMSDPTLGSPGKARLLAEAKSAAKLNHPHIVTVYDAGEAEGTPFIVMELVEGPSLYHDRPQSLAEILVVTGQICAALEHAHEKGIIHRDLKPENVVVMRKTDGNRPEPVDASRQAEAATVKFPVRLPADWQVKLMDFGLARSADSTAPRLTEEGTLVGTFNYLAPELLMGQPASAQSDLYALGVMLYELTTGWAPFTGENFAAVAAQHLHATVVPPRAHTPALPPELDALILKLLSKKPEERPASAREVLQAVTGWQDEKLTVTPSSRHLVIPSPLDTIVRGQIIGREKELTEAAVAWNKAVTGEGGVLLISGEPGIGKTRLVREIAGRAETARATVLMGECYAEGGAPYSPVVQIISTLFSVGPLAQILGAALSPVALADLITLAPDLRAQFGDLPPNAALDAQSEQQRLFESVAKLLSALAGQAPVLMVVDDAHWADSGTLALLRHLARRIPRLRLHLLVVLTYREIELSEARALHEVLNDLNRERLATRLKLGRLSLAGTRDLMGAMLAGEAAPALGEAVHREAEGNPFFVEEIVKGLVEAGHLIRENSHWRATDLAHIQVPQSIRLAIETRVSKLVPPAQETLRLAAMLGREFDFETLQHSSDETEDVLIDALEAAERAQLVSELRRGARVTFAFAHALIPATLRESLSGLRRQRLHRRVVAALEALRPDDYEVLAYHCAQGGDEARALTFYLKAGERALAAYAHQEAEKHLRAALELVEGHPARVEILALLGETLFRQAQYEAALGCWHEAIPLYQAQGNWDAMARWYARSTRAAWNMNDTLRGLALGRDGLSVLATQTETPALAALLHEVGRACYFVGQVGEAEPLCSRALAIAERFELLETQAEALTTLALVYENKRQLEQALEMYDRVFKLCEAHELSATAYRAHNNFSNTLRGMGRLTEARRHMELALEATRRIGATDREIGARMALMSHLVFVGEFEPAEAQLVIARQMLPTVPTPELAEAHMDAGELALLRYRGDLEAVVRRAPLILAGLRARHNLQFVFGVSMVLADALRELGYQQADPARLTAAEQIFTEILEIGDKLGNRLDVRLNLAVVYAQSGRPSEAQHMLAEARTRASDPPTPVEQFIWTLTAARVGMLEQKWDEAFALTDESLALTRRYDVRWHQAMLLCEYAAARLKRGAPEDSARARALLTEALQLFEAMQATIYAAQVRQKLQEIG